MEQRPIHQICLSFTPPTFPTIRYWNFEKMAYMEVETPYIFTSLCIFSDNESS